MPVSASRVGSVAAFGFAEACHAGKGTPAASCGDARCCCAQAGSGVGAEEDAPAVVSLTYAWVSSVAIRAVSL